MRRGGIPEKEPHPPAGYHRHLDQDRRTVRMFCVVLACFNQMRENYSPNPVRTTACSQTKRTTDEKRQVEGRATSNHIRCNTPK